MKMIMTTDCGETANQQNTVRLTGVIGFVRCNPLGQARPFPQPSSPITALLQRNQLAQIEWQSGAESVLNCGADETTERLIMRRGAYGK